MRLVILGIILSLIGHLFHPGMAMAETCVEWVAKAASVQGSVEVRRAGEVPWTQVQRHDTFCPGDIVRVRERSRLAIVAQNGSNHRLDENTTITITQAEPKQTFLLNLRAGAAYFFSRLPRSLKVMTPFANAGVEGTEFFVKVERNQTFLSVFEGRVDITNPAGSLTLASGQSAIAKAEQAPALRMVVRPRDAVQWALHYPPIIDFRPADFPGEAAWQAMVRQSILFYWQGDLPSAFASIAAAPSDIRDPRFFTYRAALLLTVGRVEEARVDIERALTLDPRDSHALALQSIIALAQSRRDEALQLAQKAVALEPTSSVTRVALSYAQQARFDLQEALASLKAAVTLPPENALAWARLAELWLSVGNLKKALDAAQRAVTLNPQVARTQTVLGFAFLTRIKIRDAKNAFEKAIQLDQTAPLPRLGLGLAQIRQGKLKEGRSEIEIAVSLDPNNSLIRSYLGKAYFEEKRDKLARDQFTTAKEIDPQDPTPWFYDAIRKQTVNRPVEALQDLQKSIQLNDNRVVYRSRLSLDEDLAARSASLGRIYKDLEFQQRALVEGWKSVTTDPANHSAHRLLADSYAARPRHDIARVSELLQAQLLQPLNINSLQPQLAETSLQILEGAGPSDLSFNEFNPLFMRDRVVFQANGLAGNNNTFADDMVLSGIKGSISWSLGQFHYETDGFRKNADLKHDIYNVFVQAAVTPDLNLQAEYRRRETDQGDLQLNFEPDDFGPADRGNEEQDTVRIGGHYSLIPNADFIFSGVYTKRTEDQDEFLEIPPGAVTRFRGDDEGYQVEVQYILKHSWFNATIGGGVYDIDTDNTVDLEFPGPCPVPFPNCELIDEFSIQHENAYLYTNVFFPSDLTLTLGLSYDCFDGRDRSIDKVLPKLGILWNATDWAQLRFAYFRTLARPLAVDQTIEPTQVAGFNQFFDDIFGTEVQSYGVGLDVTLTRTLYGGAYYLRRDLEVPLVIGQDTRLFDRSEDNYRVYIYWTPHHQWAISTSVEFEQFKRVSTESTVSLGEALPEVKTLIVPLSARYFHPLGIFAEIDGTFVRQTVELEPASTSTKDSDAFFLLDAAIGYRLPKRLGIISVEARNLLDEEFFFQDDNTQTLGIDITPSFTPERTVFVRATFAFN